MTERAGFDEVYVRYKGQIHRYCYLKLGSLSMGDQLAEEAANDVFMVLWEKWDTLERKDGLRAWLYRTADNVARNKLRAERRRSPAEYIEDIAVRDSVAELSTTDEYFANDVSEQRFAGHMKSVLGDDEYKLFCERFIRKKPYDEIASEAGLAYSTVRWRSLKLERIVRREIKSFAGRYPE